MHFSFLPCVLHALPIYTMVENVILLKSFYLELSIFSAESPIVGRDFDQNTQDLQAQSLPSTCSYSYVWAGLRAAWQKLTKDTPITASRCCCLACQPGIHNWTAHERTKLLHRLYKSPCPWMRQTCQVSRKSIPYLWSLMRHAINLRHLMVDVQCTTI
jgi:hypothetical protein